MKKSEAKVPALYEKFSHDEEAENRHVLSAVKQEVSKLESIHVANKKKLEMLETMSDQHFSGSGVEDLDQMLMKFLNASDAKSFEPKVKFTPRLSSESHFLNKTPREEPSVLDA